MTGHYWFSTYYRISPHLGETDVRWLDLLARQTSDLIERRRIEAAREQANDELDRRVKDRTKWLTLVHEIAQAIDEAPSWRDALELILRRICDAGAWQAGYVYLPAADAPHELAVAVGYCVDPRFESFDAVSRHMRYARGQSLPGRVFDDGHHVWVNDPAAVSTDSPKRSQAAAQAGLQAVVGLPVRVGNDVLAVVELCSGQFHHEEGELVRLMRDVSTQIGRMIEEERMIGRVGEIIWGEQQELIHTLHDAIGQHLTGVGMLAASLNQRLKTLDAETARTAGQIATSVQDALERVRELSRGLFPADIDGDGFVEALRQLASTTESLYKVPCSLECPTPIAIANSRVATQLYRIAQEAVTNALRHAQAEHIRVRVQLERETMTLRVTDDGVGIDHCVPNEKGMGLRIMRHRAASIAAAFSASPGSTRGTVVTCTLDQRPT